MEDVPAWPSNTTAVERAIRCVKEAGKHVRGADARDGRVLNQMEARRLVPKKHSKCDFAPLATAKLNI